jgi:hypothetical protein
MRLDHVQLAAPPDCEEQARGFYERGDPLERLQERKMAAS